MASGSRYSFARHKAAPCSVDDGFKKEWEDVERVERSSVTADAGRSVVGCGEKEAVKVCEELGELSIPGAMSSTRTFDLSGHPSSQFNFIPVALIPVSAQVPRQSG